MDDAEMALRIKAERKSSDGESFQRFITVRLENLRAMRDELVSARRRKLSGLHLTQSIGTRSSGDRVSRKHSVSCAPLMTAARTTM